MRHDTGIKRNGEGKPRKSTSRTTPFVKELGREISQRWANEFKGNHRAPAEESILKLLVKALAGEVAKELGEEKNVDTTSLKDTLIMTNKGPAAKGLAKAERKLAKLAKHGHPDDDDDDENEQKEKDAKYPNLKYRQPKYKKCRVDSQVCGK